ncbi:MAG: hypothetical protein C5B53_02440 [Candidatus Melainabacteria bacterium]|nr:MAG: hypothetical protein C5B53_02440 [Candidatus Melainabacteria bacterium]
MEFFFFRAMARKIFASSELDVRSIKEKLIDMISARQLSNPECKNQSQPLKKNLRNNYQLDPWPTRG